MRTFKTCTVGLASLLITGFGVSAPAAEAGDEFAELDSMMLEEIVVTARRREESAQTVPVAITAITADDLKNRSAIVLSDVAKETPSLSIQSRQGDQNTQIVQLRGQVQTDAAATLDPSVGVYLNDIYVSRNNGANFELFDVERVEILAGPQGTLYGRNTTGGAVKLITTPADLKGKMNGYATVGAGSFNGRRVEGAVNIPVSENAAVRVAGISNTREGYGTTKIGRYEGPLPGGAQNGANPFVVSKSVDTDDKNTKAARISALYEATEKLTFSMVSDYAKQVTNGNTAYDLGSTSLASPIPFGTQNEAIKPYGNYSKSSCSDDFYTGCQNFTPKADVKTFGTALTAAYDTSIGTAKVIYGYRSTDGFYNSDLEGSPLSLENLTVPTKTHQNTLETQLQGQTDKLDYTVGLYYFQEAGSEIFNDFGALTQGTRTFNAKIDNESTSIYGQTGYSLTKTVRLTTGLRYTEDTKGIENRVILQPGDLIFPNGLCLFSGSGTFGENGLGSDPNAANCKYKGEDTFGHLSWTVGVDWQPTDGILTYLKASDGYRSGGQNVRGIDAATSQPFQEETIRDIELGLKSRLADRVRLNLTYYHSQYSDIQTTTFLTFPFPQNTTTTVINQGSAKIDGLEAQSIIVASDNLSFDISGSYTAVDYARPNVVPVLTPEYKGSVGANLFFPMSFGDMSARLSYAYQAKYNDVNSKAVADAFPENVSGSRGLVDARLAFNLKEYDLNIALYGTNLTNKEYAEVVTPFIAVNEFNGAPIDPTSGPVYDVFNRVQVGAPRMFGLELSKRF
jgi:iron complex outermembrane receptor protein